MGGRRLGINVSEGWETTMNPQTTQISRPMIPLLPEVAFSKILCRERQGRRPIAIGAMLVTAWLSTATAAPLGADRQAPTKPPESHGLKSQAPESQTLRLRFDNGLLSLHASRRSFAEVLGAIQKETGIRFHYTLPMAEAVTLSFDDLPMPDALKRLLGREAQFIFRFPQRPSTASRTGVPEEVWIFGKVSGPSAEAGGPVENSAPSVEGGIGRTQSPELPAPANPTSSEQPDSESLIEATKSEDPIQRLQALSTLAESDQAEQGAVHAVLEAALTDEDAGVRARAVQALVRRDGSAYLEHALHDPDPGVRIMALGSVVLAKHGVDLVKQALSDADPAVRAMAEAMLHNDRQVRKRRSAWAGS